MRKTSVCLLIALVLALCSKAWAATPAKITFATRDVREVYPGIVEQFNTTHPDIDVELLLINSDEYKNKMITMFSAGVAPDVFFVYEGDIPEWIRKGLMQNLDSFMARDSELNRSRIYEATFEPMTHKNSVFGISEYVNPNGLVWFNKTLFEEQGIESPVDLYRANRWTMDDMRQYAKKLSKFNSDGSRDVWGLHIPNWWGPMLSFLMCNGFEVSDTQGRLALDTPTNIAAVDYLRTWVTEDLSTNAYEWPDEAGLLKQKKLAMTISGGWYTWVIDPIKPIEVDVVPMPVGITGARASVISNPAIGMSPACKDKDAAWSFMKYILVGEGARVRALNEGDLPSAKALTPLVEGAGANWKRAMSDSMSWAVSIPNVLTVRGPEAMNTLLYGDESLEGVWRGQQAVKSVLTDLQKRISAMPVIGE